MTTEQIITKLQTADNIYAYMYGRPYILTSRNNFYEPDKIIKIPISDLLITEKSIYYIWGYPGPDYNMYLFSDYGATWAFTEEEIKPVTLEEWKNLIK